MKIFMHRLLAVVLVLCAITSAMNAQTATMNGATLNKQVSNTSVQTGVVFTYDIAYHIPAGSSDIKIWDQLPTDLEFISVSAPATVCSGNPLTVTAPASGTMGGSITFTFGGTITAACSGTFQILVRFPNGTTCSGVRAINRACMTGRTPLGGLELCTSGESAVTSATAVNPWSINKRPVGTFYTGLAPCANVTPSDTVEYEISVVNSSWSYGVLNLANATVTDAFPAGTIILSTTPAATVSGTTVTWNLGNLLATTPYNFRVFRVRVAYPPIATGTVVNNTATLSGSLGKRECNNPLNTSATTCVVKGNPPSQQTGRFYKWVSVSGNSVGCTGSYYVYLYNNSTTTSLNTFGWTDNIPTGVTVNNIQVIGNSTPVSLSINGATPTTIGTLPSAVITAPPAITSISLQNTTGSAIPPGGAVYVLINFTINAAAPTSIVNTATITGGGITPTSASAQFGVFAPAPRACVYKFVCPKATNPNNVYKQGDIVRYRLRVQNIGTADMTNATITDALNSNLQYVGNPSYYSNTNFNPPCGSGGTWTTPPTPAHTGNNLKWTGVNIPRLNCQQTIYPNCGYYGTFNVPYYFIEFDVKIRDTSGLGSIANNFVISGSNFTTETSNNEYITVAGNAGFTLNKQVSTNNGTTYASAGTVGAYGNVRYRLGMNNFGTTSLSKIVMVDLLPRDNGANDGRILNRPLSRNSDFDMFYITFAASTHAVTTQASSGTNLNLPDFPYLGGTTTPSWAAAGAGAKNIRATFTPPLLALGNLNYDFNAQADRTVRQTACNSFAVKLNRYSLIQNGVNVPQTEIAESDNVCLTGTTRDCCEEATFEQTEDGCCSQLKITCPVRSVEVVLENGVFSNLNWTYNTPAVDVEGMTRYTLTNSLTREGTLITACFTATSDAPVIITYIITFQDGTTCEKREEKRCCCKPTISVPEKGCAGIALNFSIDTETCIIEDFVWDFGDGTTLANVANPTHAYANAGGYEVTLTYRDNCGEHKMQYRIRVEECPCDIKACLTGHVSGLGVNFNLTNLTSSYPTMFYLWTFGDGTTGTGLNGAHTYNTYGDYEVCVTVYAFNGKDICECQKTFCVKVSLKEGAEPYGLVCEGDLPARMGTNNSSTDKKATTNTKFNAFPNPFDSNITVEWTNDKDNVATTPITIHFVNMIGQVIATKTVAADAKSTTIETKALPTGVYQVIMYQNGRVVNSTKMIKNTN